uniref:A1 n=1 Tax=Hirudo verbana TaxID=311461 RepID=A0A346D5P1_9ANNE|nr:A1 [Hirudo verbana]
MANDMKREVLDVLKIFISSNHSEEAVNCIAERFKEDIQVPTHFNAAYIAVEIIIAFFAIFFNVVIIYLYIKNAYIRKSATNMYIISLAVADFLVGLIGIPAAILTSIGLPENFSLCLISTSILLQICTTSIFNLVAVTLDRYLAILRPLRYQTLMNKRKVRIIISLCWIAGFFIGFIPLMGFNKGPPPKPRLAIFVVHEKDVVLLQLFLELLLRCRHEETPVKVLTAALVKRINNDHIRMKYRSSLQDELQVIPPENGGSFVSQLTRVVIVC